MNCPYCNAEEHTCVPDVVYIHAEQYGEGNCNFKCLRCGKVINANAKVTVTIEDETKTRNESDW